MTNRYIRNIMSALLLFGGSMAAFAQTDITVTLTSSQGLAAALSQTGADLNGITGLKVINDSDGKALTSSDFAILNGMKALRSLDLSADTKTTVITSAAFQNNAVIEDIKFPANLSNLESGAFNGSALKGVVSFPPTLTSAPAIIGRFHNCQGLEGYAFPDNKVLMAIDGVAYCDGGKTLLSYPCGRPGREFTVPEGVTKVQDQSFYYNNILEVLNLPSTMTAITGNSTFRESTALKAVNVAAGNTMYASSAGLLVDLTTKELVYCPPMIEDVVVDGSMVTSTPNYRFFGASPLVRSMTFTEGVETIADNGCRMNQSENLADGSGALTSIYLPSTLTTVGGNAFCRRGLVNTIVCRAMTPPAVGGNAFFDLGKSDPDELNVYVPAASLAAYSGWGNLASYGAKYLPYYTITIDSEDIAVTVASPLGSDIAFEGATVEISAPRNLDGLSFERWEVLSSASVKFAANGEYSATASFTMPAANVMLTPLYRSIEAGTEATVTLSSSLNLASALAAPGIDCTILQRLNIVNNTDGAALSASDFALLASLPVLNTLDLSADTKTTAIPAGSFKGNASLTAIVFPEVLTSIGAEAFDGSALRGVVSLPTSYTDYDGFAACFNNCQSLKAFDFTGNAEFMDYDGVAFAMQGKILVKYPSGKAGSSYIVPDGVETLADYCLAYNSSLEEISLPASLAALDAAKSFVESMSIRTVSVAKDNARYAASKGVLVDLQAQQPVYCPPMIETIYVDGCIVKTVGSPVFANAANAASMTFTDGVERIGDDAFRLAGSTLEETSGALTLIDLPSTLTALGDNAFAGRGRLSTVIVRAAALPAAGSAAFADAGKLAGELKVYVPAASLEAYKAWGGLAALGAEFVPFHDIEFTYAEDYAEAKSDLGTGIAVKGAKVEISTPREYNGLLFTHWEAEPAVAFADETSASTTFAMPDGKVTLTPVYEDVYVGDVSDYTASWIANDGGKPADHIPHSMESIFVREDGTVATICGWDEGGTNVGVWRDGAVYSVPFESGTGSWGRNSGKAVAMDGTYVYQLMSFSGAAGDNGISKNSNGLQRFPPKSEVWHFVARYRSSDGVGSRFKTGYGPAENLMLVAQENDQFLTGLTIYGNDLIVAVPGVPERNIPPMLKIYDKTTMAPSATAGGALEITEGEAGYIVADKKGFVWMYQPDMNRIVAISLTNGAVRPQSVIEIPEGVEVNSFGVDPYKNRVLVPNRGKDLNVLIYTDIYNTPTLTSTFGVTGGIYVKSPKPAEEGGGEYQEGEMGHLRFPGPTGVGVDAAGNIYISNMFVNTATAILYSYKEDTGELNWKLEGLSFTGTADFSTTNRWLMNTPDKLHKVNYNKAGGRLDRLVASTLNPFAFPDDFRNFPSPIICSVFNRNIEGKEIMFVSNMYSSILGAYRFDSESHGYTAIPCNVISKDYYWEDADGNGLRSDDETTTFPTQINTFSMYPDEGGNVWMTDAVASQAVEVKYFKNQGLNASGGISYAEPISYRLPPYIIEAGRVMYAADRDELYITAYTTDYPNPNTAIWGRAGAVLLIYKNMRRRLAEMDDTSMLTWQPDAELEIPVAKNNDDSSAKSLAFAGDYLFVMLTRNGTINIYNRTTLDYVGCVEPGKVAGNTSGWTDITYALNARLNDSGTYELLAEENGYAKVMHYLIRSLSENAGEDVADDPDAPESGVETVFASGANEVRVSVYPNPATSYVTIDTDAERFRTSVYSTDGRLLDSRPMINGETLDVTTLAPGLYLLDVVTDKGHHCTRLTVK